MTITNLEEYKQQAQGKEFLGRVVFFCQFDAIVPFDELKDALDAAGLGDHCPRRPSSIDVFRRVSTAAQRKKIDVGDGKYVNILVRDVSTDEDQLLRRVVVETVDAQGKRLDYSAEHDLIFDRASQSMRVEKLTFYSTPADGAVKEITANYARLQGTIDAGTVRAVVSRVLKAHHAISARPTGGADFLLEANAGVVDALETLPGKIPGCWIHAIPLIADAKQREYVKTQVEDDVAAEVDSALNEMRKLLAAGEEITSAKFVSVNNQYKQLTTKINVYAEKLDDQLDGAKARLTIFSTTMAALASRVKVAA